MTLRNPGTVNLTGPPVSMNVRNLSAKIVLMELAQKGGYGFVYVDKLPDDDSQSKENDKIISRPISLFFRNENYGRAFNTALLAAGLQAKRDGNIIFAGPDILTRSLGAQVSKVYRLNQSGPIAAADYLSTLGATVLRVDTITTSVSQGVSVLEGVQGAPSTQTSQTQAQTFIEEYRASSGPLVGLRVTTDTRLGTITLVGEASTVSVAEQYLKKLDLRQRQVALSLKILDVDLGNNTDIANSFAIRWGDTFIVNDRGSLLGAFGRNVPPSYQNIPNLPGGPAAGFSPPQPNPGLAYPDSQFFDFLRAQVVSKNTKLLASPTLILQENPSLLRGGGDETAAGDVEKDGVAQGIRDITIDSAIGRRRANEGVVRVGTNVVTNYRTNETQGVISCVPVLSTSGLVLGARVEKIDDNGFVTFTLSPSISAITGREPAPAGCGADLNILSIRTLDTGALRVRDGQTLILTGVISDFTRSEVTKWPILGDIPLIGQFFRGTSNQRDKRELVIMVTPKIINDEEGGVYGYGYQPSSVESREFFGSAIQNGGFN
jgi:type IV pilus assembly protein PilQ